MLVTISNQQKTIPINNQKVTSIVEEFLALEGVLFDEVSITFVNEEEISLIHKEYFNDPSPTDCISFPFEDTDNEHKVLGDAIVCPAVAKKYVLENGGEVETETTLYLIHSLLHLLGYDDIDHEDRLEMRKAEARHMKNLNQLNLSV